VHSDSRLFFFRSFWISGQFWTQLSYGDQETGWNLGYLTQKRLSERPYFVTESENLLGIFAYKPFFSNEDRA
jgi:hypothetical protein